MGGRGRRWHAGAVLALSGIWLVSLAGDLPAYAAPAGPARARLQAPALRSHAVRVPRVTFGQAVVRTGRPRLANRASNSRGQATGASGLAVDGGAWTFVGPKPISGVNTYGPTSGRITGMAVDPNNSSIIYASTAGGGVWKTTDGGTNWAPLTDSQVTLATGGVAVDAASPSHVYATTGEDNRCGDCQYGQGILTSADGGATWSISGSTGLQGGPIAIDNNRPGHVFAATDQGLLESGNYGQGWVASGLNGLSPNVANVDALFEDPTTPTRIWAGVSEACNASGFIAAYDSTSSAWSINLRLSSIAGLPPIDRIGLAEGPGGVLYAALAACNSTSPTYALGQFVAILKSSDSGAHWSVIKPTASNHLTDYFSGAPGNEQGDYDNVVAVNPADANQAVFGGVTMLATSDGGTTFKDIVMPYSGGPVHPDFHAAVFSAGALLVGNDGGVYRTTDLGTTWSNLSATLAITTFYDGAALDANHIVGGAQDEGTSGLLPGGPTPPAWRELLGSDGGHVSLDPSSTAMYGESPGAIWKGATTYSNASPWTLADPCGSTGSDQACKEPVDFTEPFAVNWSTNTIFTATNRVYRSTSGGIPAGAGWTAISGDLTTGTTITPYGDWITAMAFQAPDTLVVGSYGGKIEITQNATAAQPSWTDLSNGAPAFDPNMYSGRPWITSLALDRGQVWATVGTAGRFGRVIRTAAPPGPLAWTYVDGSLPTLGVNSIAIDPASAGTAYIGTDIGPFICGDCLTPPPAGQSFTWAAMGSAIPNAMVDAITVQHDNATVVAFTHGRGAYTLPRTTAFAASAPSVDFGYGTVGTPGPNVAVTITGAGITTSTSVTASLGGTNPGDFAIQSPNGPPANCQALGQLAPQAACQLAVDFDPQAEGTRTATLKVSDAQGASVSIPLSGVGSHPVVSVSPTSVNFGSSNVGTQSVQQTVFVNNTGQGPLTVSQVGTSGDFNEINGSCYLVVPGGHFCYIYVSFTPTAHGTRTGTLSIYDNAAGSPHTVSLTGFGTQPAASLSTTTLTFPDTPYPSPTTGPTQQLTITNPGDGPLTIRSTNSSIPDFQPIRWGAACVGGVIQPSQSCTFDVPFNPTQVGNRNGTLTITDDANPSQQTVTLSGKGIAAPFASFDLPQVYFGVVNTGTSAGPQPVKLTNTGTAALNISSLTIVPTSGNTSVPEYSQTNDCPSSLGVRQSCTIKVTFAPTRTGTDYAAVSISDNESNSPQQIGLYGEGGYVQVSLSPSTLAFDPQTEGTSSPSKSVMLSETGTGQFTISSMTSSSKDFTVASDCPRTGTNLPPCFLYITFTPTTVGPLSATISVLDNATDGSSPQTVIVSGTGTAGPQASVTPSSLAFTFPPQAPATSSPPRNLTLTNTGHANLTINSVTAVGDFHQTNNCPGTLPGGASCSISVTFMPTGPGDLGGALYVYDNAPGSPQVVQLTGTTILTASSGPTVTSWGKGRLDVFALGADGALWHRYYDSSVGWQGWSSLGAPPGVQLASDPAAVSWGYLRIDVFIKGSDGALWHKYYDANYGGWSGWYSHGGTLTSAPAAASWGWGRLDVFAKGASNDLQHIFYSPYTGWTKWYSHGGNLTSAPGAVSWGNGRIDVFARGTTNDLQHIFYDVALNGWSAWYSHGGSLTGRPGASSWGRGRLDVFANGNAGIDHLTYDSSAGGWLPWVTLQAGFNDPSPVSWGPGRIDLFVQGLDQALNWATVIYNSYYANGAWSYWSPD